MRSPPSGPEPRMPTVWRVLMHGDDVTPAIGLCLAFFGGVFFVGYLPALRSGDPAALEAGVACVAGVWALWWYVSRIRRALRQGSVVIARVTHFARHEWRNNNGIRPQISGASHTLRVEYEVHGTVCFVDYALSGADVDRLHVTAGNDVFLILYPQLEKPLLRDLYLDP
jgi:hypothetical protein